MDGTPGVNAEDELIAEVRLSGVDADGNEKQLVVGVGRPRREPTGEWACPTRWSDFESPRKIYGQDPIQVICLGLSMIRSRLENFLDAGGRLFSDEGGDEISRDDIGYWFSHIGTGAAG